MLARIAPEMLCHTEKIAPGTVAIARFENETLARDVARPEFYIPISIDIAFTFDKGILSNFPSRKPQPYPKML